MSILKMSSSGGFFITCRQNFFSILAAGFFCLLSSTLNDVVAQGNLLVTPKRVVFEGNKRSFDLNLANTGIDTSIYAVSLVQIRMKDDGTFEQITEPDPGQRFADKYIRFFPRSVTLGPGESQSVKVNLLNQREMENGEYRSHFYFRAVPKPTPLGQAGGTAQDSTAFSVRLTPIFGITIPVIIRVGESDSKVSITGLSLSLVNDTIPVAKFTFNRTGNMSVYGDLAYDHISPQGKVTRVGIANGVAVYTPNSIRHFQINLNRVAGVNFRSGRLRVTYSASSDLKPAKYAEAEITLQ
jgi:hypothetical protein